MSRRISSFRVPSATTLSACVCPRVNSAEPCVRGVTPTSIEMSRISFSERPSGRFLWTAMRSRMIDFSSLSKASCTAARRSLAASSFVLGGRLWRGRGVLLEDRGLDRLGRVLALELVLDLRGVVERRAVRGADLVEQLLVDADRLEDFLLLADLRGEVALQRAELLDLGVGDVERVEDLGLGDLVGAGLDHQDGLLGAGDDQVEVGGVSRRRRRRRRGRRLVAG